MSVIFETFTHTQLTSTISSFASAAWSAVLDSWMEVLIVAAALHIYLYVSKPARAKNFKAMKAVPKTVDCCAQKAVADTKPAMKHDLAGDKFRKWLNALLTKNGVAAKAGPDMLDRYEAFIQSQGGRQSVDMRALVKEDASARTLYTGLISCCVAAARPPAGARFKDSVVRAWTCHLISDMRLFNFDRNQEFYSAVLKTLTSSRVSEDTLWLYDEAVTDGVEPDRSMYICLLNMAVASDRIEKALFFFNALRALGAPSMRTYMTALRIFVKRNDWKGAVELLNGMDGEEVCPDALVLNTVLGLCVQVRQLHAAETLLSKWETNADVISFNILMKGYAQYGSLAQGEAMLARMLSNGPPPNLITFNTMMDIAVRAMQPFSKTGQNSDSAQTALRPQMATAARRPWELLDQLTQLGLHPDRYTCSTLVKGMHLGGCTVDDIDRAVQLLRSIGPEALQNGQGGSPGGSCNARLLEVLFNTLLDACVNARDLERMASIFNMMEEFQVKVSAVTFGTLIKAFGQAGKLSHCHEVWQKLHDAKIAPTIVTFGCYIDACIRCDDIAKAEEVFCSMPAKAVQPNAVIFTSLIRGFAQVKQPLKALEIYKTMRDQGIEATTITFNSVLDVIARQLTDPDKLQEVLTDMQEARMKPDAVTHSILIKASCNAGNLKSALMLLRQIRSYGLLVDEVAVNTLLVACSKAAQVTEAEEVFAEMLKLGMKPTHVTASVLVKMYGKARMLEKAIDVAVQLRSDYNIQPNLFIYTCLIQACVQNRQVRRGWDMFNQMLRDKLQPDSITYGTLIHGCIYRNKFEDAMTLVRHACMAPQKLAKRTTDTPPALEATTLDHPIALQPDVVSALRSALKRKEEEAFLTELDELTARMTALARSGRRVVGR